MKKILFRVLVAVGIYLLFLILRTVYLWWKYIKESNSEIKFVSFLKKDDTLRDLSWILPLALGSAVINSVFRNNVYYVITICVITGMIGIYIWINAFRSKEEVPEDEEIIKRKKLLIASIIFGLFLLEIFWSKYFYQLLSPDYRIYIAPIILLFVTLLKIFKAIKDDKPIRSMPGFFYHLGILLLFTILIVLDWINS